VNTSEQLQRSVRGTAEDLERLVSLINGDEVDCADLFTDHGYGADDDPGNTALVILEEWPLEAYVTGRRDIGGSWDVTGVVVVFGTGGPHIELDTNERAVVGYWGSDRFEWTVSGAVVDYFEQWADA